MTFKPFDRMRERVQTSRSDSDTTFFTDLMYLGEFVVKLMGAGLVAAIDDDRDRSRYTQLHMLVRADGVGDWSQALREVLNGPAARRLQAQAQIEQRQLNTRCGPGDWQYEAAKRIHSCLQDLDPRCEPLPNKVNGHRWIQDFVQLRNKTRGHGAPLASALAALCPALEESINIIVDNFTLFSREWAYLHRNLSGKYRVTKLGETSAAFDELKRDDSAAFPDGVYVAFDRISRVDLLESTADAADFYLPNGNFNDKTFEVLSYITGDLMQADAAAFLGPVGPLPGSETEGLTNLDAQGKCFGNIPDMPSGYIRRESLEAELVGSLSNERHPVITLVGRGGIGKTSLAIAAVHALMESNRFDVMLWFSARDIDLLPEGPKQVRPAVLGVKDVAKEYTRLIEPAGSSTKDFDDVGNLATTLNKSPIGPLLVVFDNFETISKPTDFFNWIDTHIRPPNKVLITTRHRAFKGDYPIEVQGMTEDEFQLAGRLRLASDWG